MVESSRPFGNPVPDCPLCTLSELIGKAHIIVFTASAICFLEYNEKANWGRPIDLLVAESVLHQAFGSFRIVRRSPLSPQISGHGLPPWMGGWYSDALTVFTRWYLAVPVLKNKSDDAFFIAREGTVDEPAKKGRQILRKRVERQITWASALEVDETTEFDLVHQCDLVSATEFITQVGRIAWCIRIWIRHPRYRITLVSAAKRGGDNPAAFAFAPLDVFASPVGGPHRLGMSEVHNRHLIATNHQRLRVCI